MFPRSFRAASFSPRLASTWRRRLGEDPGLALSESAEYAATGSLTLPAFFPLELPELPHTQRTQLNYLHISPLRELLSFPSLFLLFLRRSTLIPLVRAPPIAKPQSPSLTMVATATLPGPIGDQKLEKKPIKFSNLLLGAGLNMFEVTTLGQPLEVVKTTMAAHRGDGFGSALGRIWARGGVLGCT